MKKITATLIVLITVIGAAFASGDLRKEDRATIVSSKAGIYRVIYDAEGESVVKVLITDEKGRILRNDRIKSKDGFMRPYNFEKLADGTYTIVLSDRYGKISKEVTLGQAANKPCS